jgi:hypothetical protein
MRQIYDLAKRVASRARRKRFEQVLSRYGMLEIPCFEAEPGLFRLPDIEKRANNKLPPKFGDESDGTRFIERPKGSPRCVLAVPGDRSFFCGHFLVVDSRQFIYDLGLDNKWLINESNIAALTQSCRGRNINRKNGTVCYLSNSGLDNYFHWIILTLPMVHYCRLAGHPIDHVFLNKSNVTDYPAFISATLERCGIAPSAVVSEPCAGDLNVMVVNDCRYAVRPESYAFVRGLFADLQKDNPTGPRRIFVDRGAGNTRRCLRNREEIMAMLTKRFSFTSIVMDNLSVSEQVNIFHNAEFIIAPHGAALTNLVFCKPGTRVVELFSPNWLIEVYRDLARATSLRHTIIIGEVEDRCRYDTNHKIMKQSDYTVQLDKITRIFES